MAMKIYLFSYMTGDDELAKECLDDRLWKLYDVKQIHNNVHLIKTDDDITILQKFLAECFEGEGGYFIVEIADQPTRYFKPIDANIDGWMDDI